MIKVGIGYRKLILVRFVLEFAIAAHYDYDLMKYRVNNDKSTEQSENLTITKVGQ